MGSRSDKRYTFEDGDAYLLAPHLRSGEGGNPEPSGVSDLSEYGEDLKNVQPRLSREEIGLRLAEVIALRGTCTRASVGAVITSRGRPISAGYVGAPSGQPHCIDVGCDLGNHGGCTRTVHAEANAVSFAARAGASTEGAELYTTLAPCYDCAKLITNAGIVAVTFRYPYRDSRGVELLKNVGIKVKHAPQPTS